MVDLPNNAVLRQLIQTEKLSDLKMHINNNYILLKAVHG